MEGPRQRLRGMCETLSPNRRRKVARIREIRTVDKKVHRRLERYGPREGAGGHTRLCRKLRERRQNSIRRHGRRCPQMHRCPQNQDPRTRPSTDAHVCGDRETRRRLGGADQGDGPEEPENRVGLHSGVYGGVARIRLENNKRQDAGEENQRFIRGQRQGGEGRGEAVGGGDVSLDGAGVKVAIGRFTTGANNRIGDGVCESRRETTAGAVCTIAAGKTGENGPRSGGS